MAKLLVVLGNVGIGALLGAVWISIWLVCITLALWAGAGKYLEDRKH